MWNCVRSHLVQYIDTKIFTIRKCCLFLLVTGLKRLILQFLPGTRHFLNSKGVCFQTVDFEDEENREGFYSVGSSIT